MASFKRPLLSRALRRAVAVVGSALVLSLAVGPVADAAPSGRAISVRPVCGTPARFAVRCHALLRTDIPKSARPLPAIREGAAVQPAVSGLSPANLQAAYGLTAAAQSSGSGATVAIVDAYDDPTAEADLAAYRLNYGLPPCTTANGCFRKVDQNGGSSYPAANSGWSVEIALDLDMVSALCPNCSILLVEATTANLDDMGRAVNRAVTMGAKYVSNSYGAIEFSSVAAYDSTYYDHPGVVVTASTGDNSYSAGISFPASSNHVIAVGGTSLTWNGSAWTQAAWSGAGSGCSSYFGKPSWQHDSGCAKRMLADVSAEADPATPVAVYNGGGWIGAGGTSASAPLIAAAYALAGTPTSASYPGSYPYLRGGLTDVVGGSNGSCGTVASSTYYYCNGIVGFDGPTGLGTPSGTTPFSSPDVPGRPTGVTGVAGPSGSGSVTVSWTAPASNGGTAITGYTATGSPGGKTCAWSSGPLSCAVSGLTIGQSYTFTVTATNAVGTSPASDPSASVVPVGTPGAPTSVSGVRGNGSVTVSWAAPSLTGGAAITGYTATASPGGATCSWSSGPLSCTVGGLANGTPYTFTVVASNIYGPGPASSPSATVTPSTVPDAPTAVAAAPGNSAATVTWTAPAWNGGAAISGYTVTSSPGAKTCSGSSPAVGCTVTGLSNGTPYTFTVTATNVAGTSVPSAASAAVTPRTVPGQPTGVTGAAGAGSVQVSWLAPAADGGSAITSYTATASPGGASCTVAAPALTCQVNGLANGTAYTFTVTASNAAGPGLASAASASATPRTVPDAPTGVVGTRGNASVSVSWTPPAFNGGAAITGYTVTASPGGATCAWTSGLHSCTVTGLANGTPYTFTVTAANVAGTSVASAASAPVTPASVPGQPTGVTASLDPNAATSVIASWTAPPDGGSPITGYTATAYDGSAFAVGMLVPAGPSCTSVGTTCTISALEPGSTIVVRVAATSAAGTGLESESSAPVNVPLVLPTASIASMPTWSVASSIELGWGSKAGSYPIDSYNVQYRKEAWSGSSFAAYVDLPTFTASQVATAFPLPAGASICFRVQAVDTMGNVGPWSGDRCTTSPLDDRSLARKGAWTTGTGSSYYRGTWIRSSTLGASVVRTSVAGKRLVLVASVCPTCGSVKVYLGSTYVKTISLASATTATRRVFTIWTTYHSGTVTLKLSTSGRRVVIDGFGVAKI